MQKVGVTVRLDEETVAFLDKLGELQDRGRSYLVRKAVADFVELHRRQIEEVGNAVPGKRQARIAPKNVRGHGE